ncbi:class I SAM-dependent methyltransferase [Corynebacterium sp. ES2794-CONJ1]|uniref:SAM-dependent methyltransferase n=1 Tax=unclassified Corynebacterium TaxID=2624378 RepID=UPI002168FBC6|nr:MULTISPECIES: class I SAM-dependent methyltransferase [unclassified Corynebacterium]MCS4489365.1 class I SAM-dependent methyltransferase [Corynebacterium sp. ES2775-CONJ]MCS4530941.1 class I SAM-dependent methyltransferase [Corynebacterium sp. ES2730-CONJ]MCU9518308.1 class I SAM-dependent methyltransferase [Corynebacterium sp. ES2794-CONJ1]
MAARARRSEAEFAAACQKAEIALTGDRPDIVVAREELFYRIAHAGWLGFAEGFMAGEWSAPDLPAVLQKLIEIEYRPRHFRQIVGGIYDGSEIPAALYKHFSGDGMSPHGTLFSSGVPTTQRINVKSYAPGARRGRESAAHFVDLTEVSPPAHVERADLADAQWRALHELLRSAHVGTGTHILDFPASGPAMALAAAHVKATVDIVSSDMEYVRYIRRILNCEDLAELSQAVRVEHIDGLFPSPKTWSRNYDAIVSVEKLEHMGGGAKKAYMKFIDDVIAPGGYIAMQTVVATERRSKASEESLAVLRAYVSPALDYLRTEDIHRLVDTHTHCRIISQTHSGSHYVEGLKMQREIFEGKLREAAADGFDITYRRLWIFQLALREALMRYGALDAAQLVLTTRRGSRRR